MTLFIRLLGLIACGGTWLSRFIGQGIAWLTAALAVTTAIIVLLRMSLQWGSIGTQESLTYMHALIIMLAGAYTLSEDGHVRVDIFYRRFSRVNKAWVNAIGGAIFLLPFAVFSFLISWDFVSAAWGVKETSADAGGIPAVYLLKTLLLCNSALLTLQGLAELAKALQTLTRQEVSQ